MDIEDNGCHGVSNTPPLDAEPPSSPPKRRSVEESTLRDNYAEAWYELGAPIFIPFVKFLIAVTIYFVDNFFLIKNTYNAVTMKDPENVYYDKRLIAGGILGLHIFSSALIGLIDSLNKDAISGRRGKYLNRKHKGMILLRMVAHLTLTMRLFRYTTMYLENRRRNKQLHTLRMRRVNISEREVQFVVDQKKNQLVESHYDLVDSFFKTVPAALLQVFFMFQTSPDARLRLYTTVDRDRFATVFFTVITASISAANYQCDYLAYKKVLHFQDCFRSGFRHDINFVIPSDGFLISNIPILFATIGIRMCFYSVLIFWSPFQFVITTSIILSANWVFTFLWNKTAWRFRPVLENPLYGLPWLCFDIIDLWINLFVPGVHYPKPLDHFLNFYTTMVTGVVIFGSFDFLTPSKTKTTPQFITQYKLNYSTSYLDAISYFNASSKNESSFVDVGKPTSNESVFFVEQVIMMLVTVHEYLTFNEISYASFFYNVVKYMNVVNAVCFGYTCLMNYLKMFDLDFPIQVVNSFYLPMLNSFHSKRVTLSPDASNGSRDVLSLIPSSSKCEIFLVFSMLRNSLFFGSIRTIKKNNWESVEPEYLEFLVNEIIRNGQPPDSKFLAWVDKFARKISPVLYPAKFREPEFKWEIPTDKLSIISSLKGHPLREQLVMFVDDVYDHLPDERKVLLAVFCANYYNIVRHYTSLRLKKMFMFFDIPIDKGEVHGRLRTSKGFEIRRDYEMGYLERLMREAKGKAIKVFT